MEAFDLHTLAEMTRMSIWLPYLFALTMIVLFGTFLRVWVHGVGGLGNLFSGKHFSRARREAWRGRRAELLRPFLIALFAFVLQLPLLSQIAD